ncbi:ead/Ea22-like family protein [Escherichia coli]|uniref:ead/Ea22-like family protein n=1 Tax=Escherichia coli TaxID=562 RepID=UPI0020232A78|nr:ead/Ea22-like family protein [Escherichia coli]MCV0835343.1 ead/Ea22-like family protein [Escherichia coli]
MTKINYQALRAKAEKATCGVWSLEYGEERFDAGDAYRGKRDLPGVPEKSGYEASIDGLGEGRGMSNKYEDLIKSARMNADCGEHMSPTEVTTLLNVVETTFAALAAEVYDLKHPGTYLPSKRETPATDAFLAEVRAQAHKEGAHFVANRMLAAWEAGFIDDTAKNAADIARMILTSTEFMADAPEGDFDRSFADGVLEDIAAQLRKGVQS